MLSADVSLVVVTTPVGRLAVSALVRDPIVVSGISADVGSVPVSTEAESDSVDSLAEIDVVVLAVVATRVGKLVVSAVVRESTVVTGFKWALLAFLVVVVAMEDVVDSSVEMVDAVCPAAVTADGDVIELSVEMVDAVSPDFLTVDADSPDLAWKIVAVESLAEVVAVESPAEVVAVES